MALRQQAEITQHDASADTPSGLLLPRGVSQRAFLQRLLLSIGGAGLAAWLAGTRSALATYTPGSPADTVNTNLKVEGSLFVTSPNRLGIGTTAPAGTLDVAGDIRASGAVVLGSDAKARHTAYAAGPATSAPQPYGSGTWGRHRGSTWQTPLASTWSQAQNRNGSWDRVKTFTWTQIGTHTWAQVQTF
jgi:hypothetical protein